MKKIELKGEREKSTNIVKYFKTLLSTTNRTSGQNIRKDREDWAQSINMMEPIFAEGFTTAGHTFFSRAHGTFIKILGHKTGLSKFKIQVTMYPLLPQQSLMRNQ